MLTSSQNHWFPAKFKKRWTNSGGSLSKCLLRLLKNWKLPKRQCGSCLLTVHRHSIPVGRGVRRDTHNPTHQSIVNNPNRKLLHHNAIISSLEAKGYNYSKKIYCRHLYIYIYIYFFFFFPVAKPVENTWSGWAAAIQRKFGVKSVFSLQPQCLHPGLHTSEWIFFGLVLDCFHTRNLSEDFGSGFFSGFSTK